MNKCNHNMKEQIKISEEQLRKLIKESVQKLLLKEELNPTDQLFEELCNIVEVDFMNIAKKSENFMKQKGFGVNHILGGIYNMLYDTLEKWFDDVIA